MSSVGIVRQILHRLRHVCFFSFDRIQPRCSGVKLLRNEVSVRERVSIIFFHHLENLAKGL